MLENMADEVGRGCFAIRACDSHALECAVGVSKKRAANIGHGRPGVWNNHNRAGAVRYFLLRNSNGSSPLGGLFYVCGTIRVFSWECEEKRARNGLSGVEAKCRDLRVSQTRCDSR